MATKDNFSDLSDEVLLRIVSYLSLSDRLAMALCNHRFWEICHDRSLMRYLVTSRNWDINTNSVLEAVQCGSKDVHQLDFSDCYWFTSKFILECAIKCCNLIKLDIQGCSVTPHVLDRILSVAVSLKHLAVTDPGVLVYFSEAISPVLSRTGKETYIMSEKACKTLEGLLEIHLNMSWQCTKRLYVIPLCRNLTSFRLSATSFDSPKYCKCNKFSLAGCQEFRQTVLNITQIEVTKEFFFIHHYLTDMLLDFFSDHSFFFSTRLPFLILRVVKKDSLSPLTFCSLSLRSHNPTFHASDLTDIGSLEELKSFCLTTNVPSNNWADPEQWTSLLEQFSAVTSFHASLSNVCKKDPTGPWMHPFLSMCSHLKNLNLLGTCCHNTKTAQNMDVLCNAVARSITKGLVTLALPTCFLVEQEAFLQKKTGPSTSRKTGQNNVLYSGPQGFGQRQRIGTSTEMPSSTSGMYASNQSSGGRLQQFVSACPNLEYFELMAQNLSKRGIIIKDADDQCCQIEQALHDTDLVCVSQWKCLTSLTLAGLPGIQHGMFLTKITLNCLRLRHLSLAYLGLDAGCKYMQALCEALKYATCLEDLRLGQPNMEVNESLCQALEHCSYLTRLCIVAHKTKFSSVGILGVFRQCKKLMVFHLITGSSLQACATLATELQQRYQTERPALNLYITNSALKDLSKKVPPVHLLELTYLQSHICVKPTEWKGLNQLYSRNNIQD